MKILMNGINENLNESVGINENLNESVGINENLIESVGINENLNEYHKLLAAAPSSWPALLQQSSAALRDIKYTCNSYSQANWAWESRIHNVSKPDR